MTNTANQRGTPTDEQRENMHLRFTELAWKVFANEMHPITLANEVCAALASAAPAPTGQPSDAQKLLNLADWIEAGCTDHPMHASSIAGWLRALASPVAPKAAPVTQADYCRYGVCEPGENHVPGCTEYAPGELATHAAEAAPVEGERVHKLKTWTNYGDVLSERKPFEVRKNDRDYRAGDWLQLQEWSVERADFTGRECFRRVTYVLTATEFVKEGFAVLGLSAAPRAPGAEQAGDVARSVLLDIARQCAAKTTERHAYLPEIDRADWTPHEWVVDAMKAAVAWDRAMSGQTAPATEQDWTEVDLWAEIHRLRAAVKGPDGYASWQEAATAERIRRVKAEQALTPKAPAEPAEQAAVPNTFKKHGESDDAWLDRITGAKPTLVVPHDLLQRVADRLSKAQIFDLASEVRTVLAAQARKDGKA